MPATTRSIVFNVDEVCKSDMDVFVENIYKDIARKLKIPFEQLKPILEEENKAFYVLKEKFFLHLERGLLIYKSLLFME